MSPSNPPPKSKLCFMKLKSTTYIRVEITRRETYWLGSVPCKLGKLMSSDLKNRTEIYVIEN